MFNYKVISGTHVFAGKICKVGDTFSLSRSVEEIYPALTSFFELMSAKKGTVVAPVVSSQLDEIDTEEAVKSAAEAVIEAIAGEGDDEHDDEQTDEQPVNKAAKKTPAKRGRKKGTKVGKKKSPKDVKTEEISELSERVSDSLTELI